MADYPDRPGYSFDPGPPPEASRFLKNKGLRPSFNWDDVEPEEHAVSFTVAKMMETDLLEAARVEVQRALDEGLPFEAFQKNWKANPRLADWWGKREMTDPVTGEVRDVQLGSPRRLRTIYSANLATARAAGQWERIQRTKAVFPYLEYRLGPSERHRPTHVAKEGLILPVDHPFWDEWMPPNGWGCKCRVRQVSKGEAARRGPGTAPDIPDNVYRNPRTGQVAIVPAGIDPGWQRNPGKLRLQAAEGLLRERLEAAPPTLRDAALRDIATSWRVARILTGEVPGSAPIAAVPDDLVAALGAKTRLALISSETAKKQLAHHPEIEAQDYSQLAMLLSDSIVVRQSETHIGLIGRDQKKPWVAILKVTADLSEMYLKTFYRASSPRYRYKFLSRGEILRD